MFKKLIISRPLSDKYPAIFEVCEGNDITIRIHDLSTPIYFPRDLENVCLPQEIVDKILSFLIADYLRDGNIVEAFDAIQTNRHSIISFYSSLFNRIYRPELHPPSIIKILNILHSFFWLALEIHETLQSERAHPDDVIGLSLNACFPFLPWSLHFTGQLFALDWRRIEVYPEIRYRSIHTGKYAKDTFWIAGASSRGVISAYFYKTPIILLYYTDEDDNAVHTIDCAGLQAWRGLSALLRKIFGADTGVFLLIDSTADEHVFSENICVEI